MVIKADRVMEFYFVRHGQTDHNLLEGKDKGDHTAEVPLNERGRQQAGEIEPLIATLPVRVVCSSPMRRVQETKEIIAARLAVEHCEIEELSECSALVWGEMRGLGMFSGLPEAGAARVFMDRVRVGLNRALSLPGRVLIVAHGGVHWAACCLLGIEGHEWAVENCAVVHFRREGEKWVAKKIYGPL
jgi:probable phosphoglycerate mutase